MVVNHGPPHRLRPRIFSDDISRIIDARCGTYGRYEVNLWAIRAHVVLPMDVNRVFYLRERRAREPPHTTPLLRARGTHRGRRRAALVDPSTARMAGSLDPNRVRTRLTLTVGKCTSERPSGVSAPARMFRLARTSLSLLPHRGIVLRHCHPMTPPHQTTPGTAGGVPGHQLAWD